MLRSVLVVALALAACKKQHTPAPGESPAEICRPENHNKAVAVSGYLVAPLVNLECTSSCSLLVGSTPDDRDGVRVSFRVGSGPNRMRSLRQQRGRQLVDGEVLRRSDFHVTDARGESLSLGDRVRVAGYASVKELGGSTLCRIDVETIREL